MTKLQDLLNGRFSAGFVDVVPVPDYEVIHSGAGGVCIQCPTERTQNEVLNWITSEKGGNWIMSIWIKTIKDVVEVLPNPHQNDKGFWCYLVRKA